MSSASRQRLRRKYSFFHLSRLDSTKLTFPHSHKRYYRLLKNTQAGKKGAAVLPATPSRADLDSDNYSQPTPIKKRKTSVKPASNLLRKRKADRDSEAGAADDLTGENEDMDEGEAGGEQDD